MIDRLNEVLGYSVSRETYGRLTTYAGLLAEASAHQNLISSSTVGDLWERHIVDSAQLLSRAKPGGTWVDIGSGAGLPGLVIAILSPDPMTLVEPRRLRVEFLQSVIDRLALGNVTLVQGKSTATTATFATITARAVAPTGELFALAHHLSRHDTVWVLPKGRNAQKELAEARMTWQGDFRLEPSLTDAAASILIATGVRRRAR
ncbi:MAG: 16S rRNA (guanine(527)-N(7))-methyltransferase RsmG [Pseudomonadota bacterium]|nr:16S rRNA (guanine(527)-N(7))-methyltransferase RsmG [Pseudomonadota bacterium]